MRYVTLTIAFCLWCYWAYNAYLGYKAWREEQRRVNSGILFKYEAEDPNNVFMSFAVIHCLLGVIGYIALNILYW